MPGKFDPETVAFLENVLEHAWNELPPHKKITTTKCELAQLILKCALEGERDPAHLKAAATVMSFTLQL